MKGHICIGPISVGNIGAEIDMVNPYPDNNVVRYVVLDRILEASED